MFGNDTPAQSREFETRTKLELLRNKFSQKTARMLYRKFRQCSFYEYHGKYVLACHGGIPHLDNNLLFIPTKDFIKGVGVYDDYRTVADTWMYW